jgi:hypothetical protein
VPPITIFSCFDLRHDAALHARLVQQCAGAGSPLSVVDWSRPEALAPDWETELRRRMTEVDAVIVICGEHTDDSSAVSEELRIAQEQGKPYILLWGRRGTDCTRPFSARPGDHFYTWIWELLTAQVALELRMLPGTP